MSKQTLGGCLYFLTFIDDYSRKVWAFAVKAKDHVLDVFKHLRVSLEKEKRIQLKCVRTNNGGKGRGYF